MAIKQLSINGQVLNITNILTTDTVHITDFYFDETNNIYRIKFSNSFLIQTGSVGVVGNEHSEVKMAVPYTKKYIVILTNRDNQASPPTSVLYFSYYVKDLQTFYIKPSRDQTINDNVIWIAFGI